MKTLAAIILALAPTFAFAEEARVIRDIEYAKVDEISLSLDLHLPPAEIKAPLIIWIHGGAWRAGSKKSMPLKELVAEGHPVASVDYRLSPVAKFPAQIHDIKAAIRFLRANGAEWKLPTENIVIAGESAGAHLAALTGVTNGNAELEGTLGTHLKASSAIQGIISFYGASDLTTILSQSTPHGLSVRTPALELLLGDLPDAAPDLARLASPVYHIDKSDPPLLLFHGDRDPQMPINQSIQLLGVYELAGCTASFHPVHGAAHGGKLFYDKERLAIVREFLEQFR
ncbi:MAG: alpha/beta hydrolase [Akkermansiaceae bacterium]|nr:alpha/beta hydrolase [Akkermansiaceae bacterium]MDP4720291.1 alpha/beta hydrolase [Akkermansiaceae bacterium]MDP4781404.1 alpha/beta hydrolase [Akkermansiaceae bacterium]MDP4897653.1 alpha/beta hydrolase [Akkermansiaceae bacterium]MDP4995024.1 alpha/beta hydrolase [Akkermansiaceae bacterium]